MERKDKDSERIYDQEEVIEAFNGAFARLSSDIADLHRSGEEVPANLIWLQKSVLDAKNKTDLEKGKDTYVNKFPDPRNGVTFELEEGIPVDELIGYLLKKISSTRDADEKRALREEAKVLLDNSKAFAEVEGRDFAPEFDTADNPLLEARKSLEAYFIARDLRATGDTKSDWFKAVETLRQRRELKLPKKVGIIEPVEDDKDQKPPIAGGGNGDTGSGGDTPPPPYDFAIINRASDIEKRSREMAEKQLRDEMRRGHAFNPLNWPRKIRLRVAEEYYRQLYIQRAREAMLVNNNSFLEMNLVTNALTAANAHITEERTAAVAKIHQVHLQQRKGIVLEGQDIVEALPGGLRNNIIQELVRPMVENNITDYAQVQQMLRDFVASHQADAQVARIFGAVDDDLSYRGWADYFASDLIEKANRVRQDINAHKKALDQLDEYIGKIYLARTSWAAETQPNFNWTDRSIRWAENHRLTGWAINPLTIGAASSIGSFFAMKLPGNVLRYAAPIAAPGVGMILGGTYAGLRRSYDLKVDRASQQIDETYGAVVPGHGAPRRAALDHFNYDTIRASTIAENLMNSVNNLAANRGSDTHRQSVIDNIAEIMARLNFSATNRVDLITYSQDSYDPHQVEQQRAVLVQIVDQARDALITAGMINDQINQLQAQTIQQRTAHFTNNIAHQDQAFHNYRLRQARWAGVVGAATGAVGALGTQEVLALADRAFFNGAPALGGILNSGPTILERIPGSVGQSRHFIQNQIPFGAHTEAASAAALPHAESLPHAAPVDTPHFKVILSPDGSHASSIGGHNITIPDGTEWIKDSHDSNGWDLIVSGRPDKVLVSDAHFDSSGNLLTGHIDTSLVQLKDSTITNTTEVTSKDGGWAKPNLNIDHREWYSYDKAGSQGNELRLDDYKSGNSVILDINRMSEGSQTGLHPNPVLVQEAIKDHKVGFAFTRPAHQGQIIWIPDGADGKWDGKLVLNPNAPGPLGEFSRELLNQQNLSHLKDGNIATELTNQRDVFNLGTPDHPGFIEAGQLTTENGHTVLQDFATIEGTGGNPSDIVTTSHLRSVNLVGVVTDPMTLPPVIPASITPTARVVPPQVTEAPMALGIATPMVPRYPLEPFGDGSKGKDERSTDGKDKTKKDKTKGDKDSAAGRDSKTRRREELERELREVKSDPHLSDDEKRARIERIIKELEDLEKSGS